MGPSSQLRFCRIHKQQIAKLATSNEEQRRVFDADEELMGIQNLFKYVSVFADPHGA